MKTRAEQVAGAALPAVVAAVAAASLGWWLRPPSEVFFDARLPGADGAAASVAQDAQGRAADMRGRFERFDGVRSSITNAWPGFRGPHRDNISPEPLALAEVWPEGGPRRLWDVELGDGYAGAAVANGCVYVLDYDECDAADSLRCFSLDDGREIWRRSYSVVIKRNHGMSRTVPAVSERFVVTIGPKCHVLCVDAVSGDFLWGLDMVAAFGTEVPLWYAGQCPLLDGGTAVLAPAGEALLVGVDCVSGRVLWEAPNPEGWAMSHSSVMPMTIGGQRMYVYCAIGGVVAVSAEPGDIGSILWTSTAWDRAVVAPSPVSLGDGRILLTAGYGAGSLMLGVTKDAGGFRVEPRVTLPKEVFACEQQTPIYYREHLFSILPKDAGALRGQLVCLRTDGTAAWTSGRGRRFGLGPFLVADGKLWLLDDDGTLVLFRAEPGGCVELGRVRVLDGREAWAPMALAAGRLLVRDSHRMVCLDVSVEGGLGDGSSGTVAGIGGRNP